MADSTVKISFVGDSKDLNRTIDDANGRLQRVGDVGKTTALALGASFVGAGVALYGFANAAAEDEKAATALATTVKNVTGATDEQTQSLEDWITAQGKAFGVADDQLRPALDSLVRGTGDLTKSQKLASLAMNISAATGKDLTTVSDALSKAYNGQLGPLKKLDPALNDLIKDGASADDVFASLSQTFEGQAAKAAETTSGKLAIAKVQFSEMQEEIGAKVLPVLAAFATFVNEKVIPAIASFTHWLEEHKPVAIAAAAVIGTVFVAALVAWAASAAAAAAATIVAMAPVIAITAAIAALAAGVIYAYTHWDWFRTAVDAVASFISEHFVPIVQTLVNIFTVGVIPAAQAVYNFFNDKVLPVLKDVAGFINDDVIPAVKAVKEKFEEFGTKVGEIWDGLKETVEKAVTFILEQIDKLTAPLENILDKVGDLAGKIGITGKGSIDWDKVKGSRAGGGPITSGSWLVGENGPEVVTVGGSGFVTPNGMGGVTIQINGPVYGMDDFERKVADAAEKFAQRNGMN